MLGIAIIPTIKLIRTTTLTSINENPAKRPMSCDMGLLEPILVLILGTEFRVGTWAWEGIFYRPSMETPL
jgi:hypothetical protein